MDSIAIRNFATFADLLAASCTLGAPSDAADRTAILADIASGRRTLDAALSTSGLAGVAAEMARVAEDHARHFTHPGQARDDALALFWQAAPSAFADPVTLAAAHFDPGLTAERMLAAVRAGPHARDFAASPLAAQFFQGVVHGMVEVMRARVGNDGAPA